MNKIDVGNFVVGADRTFIIADVGSNHMQNLELAKESIDAAYRAGADAVKFQSIKVDELYHFPDKKTIDFVKKLEFPEKWYGELNEFCKKRGVIFFSSPTYLKSVDLLESVYTPLYKLASAQAGTFPQIVEKVAKLNKPTIFSTGISSYDDVTAVVRIFRRNNNNKFIILHCNSIYPTPPERVNLPMIGIYHSMFDNPVGFSDHTNGIHISCAAVSAGAKVIEKHFTLDRSFDSPDSSSFASDPAEFGELVRSIRDIEMASKRIGDRIEIEAEEGQFKDEIIYKFVAAQHISEGDIFGESNLKYLRARGGIDCRNGELIVGRAAARDILADSLISLSDII